MKKDASYLRYAACAVFLAAAAWMLAFFSLCEQSPKTVAAERAGVTLSVIAEGTVWRDETVIVCDDEGAYLAHKTGDTVSGGAVVAVPEDMQDAYFEHLALSGGAAPDRIETRRKAAFSAPSLTGLRAHRARIYARPSRLSRRAPWEK